MKQILVLVTAIILCIFGFLLWNKKDNWTNYPSSGKGIVAFGDSLIVGVGSNGGKNLPTLLSEQIGQPVVGFGKSGDMTGEALERVPTVFTAVPNPKVVIILLGGNDFLRNVPREETFRNLETMIRTFQSRGSIVLLLGVRGGILTDGFDQDFKRLAKKMNTPYISDVLEGLWGREDLMADAIHPNSAGYEIIAERIEPVLKNLIQ